MLTEEGAGPARRVGSVTDAPAWASSSSGSPPWLARHASSSSSRSGSLRWPSSKRILFFAAGARSPLSARMPARRQVRT